VGRGRRRSGATRWSLFQDTTDGDHFVETFVLPSWEEHLRQRERITVADRRFEERAHALLADGQPPRVTHLLAT
jgi:Transmembrane secretion effector